MSEEKILKSEELNDEQLDEVAGGTMQQIYSDVEFLKKLGMDLDLPDVRQLRQLEIRHVGTVVQEAWKEIGIHCDYSPYRIVGNRYFLNGEEITQDEARIHAIKVLKGQK
ncbi:MAG: hypothetical protein IJT06_07295 [Selenomonadaceae bacterium]|nr:hypothetical protein [Selenomonadaceae bacterium]